MYTFGRAMMNSRNTASCGPTPPAPQKNDCRRGSKSDGRGGKQHDASSFASGLARLRRPPFLVVWRGRSFRVRSWRVAQNDVIALLVGRAHLSIRHAAHEFVRQIQHPKIVPAERRIQYKFTRRRLQGMDRLRRRRLRRLGRQIRRQCDKQADRSGCACPPHPCPPETPLLPKHVHHSASSSFPAAGSSNRQALYCAESPNSAIITRLPVRRRDDALRGPQPGE